MSNEASDESNSCAEPESAASSFLSEEIALLEEIFALADPRPDPGVYRNADSDGAARDLVELNMLMSFVDPRPFRDRWMPYFREEDLLEER
jgi:hypothetical protein